MLRRYFLKTFPVYAGALAKAERLWPMGEKQNGENYGAHPKSETVIRNIGGLSLEELRSFHRDELENKYLPVWDDRRIDREYGGFMPYVEADPRYIPPWKGRAVTAANEHMKDLVFNATNKEMYYQGRGIWVFSYLYNHFGKRERHLQAARKGIDFIVKYCRDEKGYWNSEVTREGKFVQGSYNIYGDIYVALGFAEYYRATGDEKIREMAVDTVHGIAERILSPTYQHLGWHGGGNEPGTKRLGTWQHFLSALTPLARYTGDDGVELTARMCVRYILERHWRPELGVSLELLDDKFQPFREDPLVKNRTVSGWHSIQAAWMSMDEALRIGHRRMFLEAMEMGRQNLEKCWYDDGEEAGLVTLANPEAKPALPDDLRTFYHGWGATDDALIFALLAIEHTHAPWAVDWFDRIFKGGYRQADRFNNHCLLHHPRRLFFVLDILNHLIDRGGKVSDFLAA